MTPRPRKRAGLADNLYPNPVGGMTYYVYQHPITGQRFGFGKDKAKANQAARICNARILSEGGVEEMVGTVLTGRPALNAVADEFWTYLGQRKKKNGKPLGKRTLDNYRDQLNRARGWWGAWAVDSITLREVSDRLHELPPNAHNAHKSLLTQFFAFANARGFRRPPPGEPENPAKAALKADVVVARTRLLLDPFKAIYARAGEIGMAWMQRAMGLALHTLQRRGDIVAMQYDDERIPGELWVDQRKGEGHGTGHVIIPIGDELRAEIQASRDGLLSPFIVHRRPHRIGRRQSKSKAHWTQVSEDMVSRAFSAIRDELKLYERLPLEKRPTFHEIRSLGGDLYRKAGWTDAQIQVLMGHTTTEMTQTYLDRRGVEVQYARAPKAGLKL